MQSPFGSRCEFIVKKKSSFMAGILTPAHFFVKKKSTVNGAKER